MDTDQAYTKEIKYLQAKQALDWNPQRKGMEKMTIKHHMIYRMQPNLHSIISNITTHFMRITPQVSR